MEVSTIKHFFRKELSYEPGGKVRFIQTYGAQEMVAIAVDHLRISGLLEGW